MAEEAEADEPINYMDLAEFRAFGYLQEINRRFLHPLGLALEHLVHEDGTETLGGIWDYRHDPGACATAPGCSITRRPAESTMPRRIASSRCWMVGYWIQQQ